MEVREHDNGEDRPLTTLGFRAGLSDRMSRSSVSKNREEAPCAANIHISAQQLHCIPRVTTDLEQTLHVDKKTTKND